MKKLLSMLGAITLTSSTVMTAMACGADKNKPDENIDTKISNAAILGLKEKITIGDILLFDEVDDEIKEVTSKITTELLARVPKLETDLGEEKKVKYVFNVGEKLYSFIDNSFVKSEKKANVIQAKVYEVADPEKNTQEPEVNLINIEIPWNNQDAWKSQIRNLSKINSKKTFLEVKSGQTIFDGKALLGLIGDYNATNAEFKVTNQISFPESNKVGVTGKLIFTNISEQTNSHILITSKNEYDSVKLNVYNGKVITQSMTEKLWKSNTGVNGVTTYDMATSTFGINPTSLHDAIALHTGKPFTGNYLFVKNSKGEFGKKGAQIGDTAYFENEPPEEGKEFKVLDDDGWGFWDAKENKPTSLHVDVIKEEYPELYVIYNAYFSRWINGAKVKINNKEHMIYQNPKDVQGVFLEKKLVENKIADLAKNADKGYSMIRYSQEKGFSVDKFDGGIGFKAALEKADNSNSVEEAKGIAGTGDAFNWGRNISGAHNLADYFNKYVHDGEKKHPIEGTVNTTYKNFEAKFGTETFKFYVKGVGPFSNDEKSKDYWGWKNQGISFKLESKTANAAHTIIEMTLDELFEINDKFKDQKGNNYTELE